MSEAQKISVVDIWVGSKYASEQLMEIPRIKKHILQRGAWIQINFNSFMTEVPII